MKNNMNRFERKITSLIEKRTKMLYDLGLKAEKRSNERMKVLAKMMGKDEEFENFLKDEKELKERTEKEKNEKLLNEILTRANQEEDKSN